MDQDQGRPPASPGPAELESTATIVQGIREGDPTGRDVLIRRYLPVLRRWARGRLPVRARGRFDTDDLVQVTFLRALDHIEEFEPRREGAFLAYLRRILMNRLKDEIRHAERQPPQASLPEQQPGESPSPLESAVGRERLEAYERALGTLTPTQQEAVIMRIEGGCTYDEVAAAIGSPSPNAARMLVARALVKLAEVMDAT